MDIQYLTKQDKADLLNALSALIHRLTHKVKHDERNGRNDFNRVQIRKDKIERAKVLIEKLN